MSNKVKRSISESDKDFDKIRAHIYQHTIAFIDDDENLFLSLIHYGLCNRVYLQTHSIFEDILESYLHNINYD